jgi:uncharacterized protein YgiM (DUF1202 family)
MREMTCRLPVRQAVRTATSLLLLSVLVLPSPTPAAAQDKSNNGGTQSNDEEDRRDGAAKSEIEPVDSLNSTYYSRDMDAPVLAGARESEPVVTKLRAGQQVKIIGKMKNSRAPEERWYQIEFADGKPRFILGQHLLSQKMFDQKKKYEQLLLTFPEMLSQISNSQGPLAAYMGFYSFGKDCALSPKQAAVVGGLDRTARTLQGVNDEAWGNSNFLMWTDGTTISIVGVRDGTIVRYKPTFMSQRSFTNIGQVQLYRLERLEPPGSISPAFAVTGFLPNGKLVTHVTLADNQINFSWATRCNTLSNVKEALQNIYKSYIEQLPTE